MTIAKPVVKNPSRVATSAPKKPMAVRKPPLKAIIAMEMEGDANGKAKSKLVRDSFTIPKVEYAVLESLKLRAAMLGRPAKKSEVIRAGINALGAMGDKAFLAALSAVPNVKTGRPKNGPATSNDVPSLRPGERTPR